MKIRILLSAIFAAIAGCLPLPAATVETATITFTNAANLSSAASGSGASITVNSDVRRWTNTVEIPGTQIPITTTSGTNISQQVQLFLVHLAAHPIAGITPSSDGSTYVSLRGATGVAITTSISPTNFAHVTSSTQTVGTGYTLRLPITVETATNRIILANYLTDALALSDSPPNYQLGSSNATVKPIRLSTGLLSIEAGTGIGLAMSPTSVVFSTSPVQLGYSNATVKPITSAGSFFSLEAGTGITLGTTTTSVVFNASSGGAVPTGGAVWVSKSGNDSTGARGDPSTPYLTPSSALSGAVAGDTIFVLPGVYTGESLSKDGVNWHFFNGSAISNIATSSPIFSDAGVGVVSVVTGDGVLIDKSGSGAIYLGSTNSSLSIKARRIECPHFGIQINGGTLNLEVGDIVSSGVAIFISDTPPIVNVRRTRIVNSGGSGSGGAIDIDPGSNGLTLTDCVLIGSGTYSLDAASASNVRIYGSVYANLTNHANITFLTGGSRFEVSTDVE